MGLRRLEPVDVAGDSKLVQQERVRQAYHVGVERQTKQTSFFGSREAEQASRFSGSREAD